MDYYVFENIYFYDVLLYGIRKAVAIKKYTLREYVIVFN